MDLFGGLSVKAKPAPGGGDAGGQSNAAPEEPASGFGFLQPEAEAAPAGGSAFSFLGGSEEDASVAEEPPSGPGEAASLSGFNFLGSGDADSAEPIEEPSIPALAPTVETATPVVRKKRRTKRVGTAREDAATTSPPPAAMPTTSTAPELPDPSELLTDAPPLPPLDTPPGDEVVPEASDPVEPAAPVKSEDLVEPGTAEAAAEEPLPPPETVFDPPLVALAPVAPAEVQGEDEDEVVVVEAQEEEPAEQEQDNQPPVVAEEPDGEEQVSFPIVSEPVEPAEPVAPTPEPQAATAQPEAPRQDPHEAVAAVAACEVPPVESPLPPPEGATSPAHTLQGILAQFQSTAVRDCFELESIHRRGADAWKDKERTGEEKLKWERKLVSLEDHQMRLAEAEDFEAADALSSEMEQVKHEIGLRADTHRSAVADFAKVEQLLESHRQSQVLKLKEVAQQLSVFQKSYESESSHDYTTMRSRLASEEQSLESERERLVLEEAQLVKHRRTLAEEEQQTEAQIEQQTKGIAESKAGLVERLAAVDAEIEELEQRLKEKQGAKASVLSQLESVEGKIQQVRAKFDRQLKRIKERDESIKQDENAYAAEERKFREDMAALSEAQNSAETNRESADKLLAQAASELSVASETAEVLETEAQLRHQVQEQVRAGAEAADKLQREYREAQALVGTAEQAVKDLISERNAVDLEVTDIQKRLPALDKAKKAAANARNFKEAASMSKEIKALDQRLATQEASSKDLEEQVAQAEAELARTRVELEQKVGAVDEATTERESLKLEALKEKATALARTLRRMRGPKSTSLLLSGVQRILEAELATATSDIQELYRRLGLEGKFEISDQEDIEDDGGGEADPEQGEMQETEAAAAVEVDQERLLALGREAASLDAEIQQAVESEDYARAEELQSELDRVNACTRDLRSTSSIESPPGPETGVAGTQLGATNEEAGDVEDRVVDEESASRAEGEAEAGDADGLDQAQVHAAVQALERIANLEGQIDELAAEEDYDAAAAVQEELDAARLEVTEMDPSVVEAAQEARGS